MMKVSPLLAFSLLAALCCCSCTALRGDGGSAQTMYRVLKVEGGNAQSMYNRVLQASSKSKAKSSKSKSSKAPKSSKGSKGSSTKYFLVYSISRGLTKARRDELEADGPIYLNIIEKLNPGVITVLPGEKLPQSSSSKSSKGRRNLAKKMKKKTKRCTGGKKVCKNTGPPSTCPTNCRGKYRQKMNDSKMWYDRTL